jgi:uncharacterized RDD family membrane protein YckC
MLGSWLSGPTSLAEAQGIDIGYPGRRLGLPEEGPGSVAGQGRRIAATFIDWMIAYVIAAGLFSAEVGPGNKLNFITLGIFGLMQVLLVGTVGTGIGGRLLRIRVVRMDGRLPGPLWATARMGLILLIFPAVVWDRDTRGLHDQITRTLVVNMGTKGQQAASARTGARSPGAASKAPGSAPKPAPKPASKVKAAPKGRVRRQRPGGRV